MLIPDLLLKALKSGKILALALTITSLSFSTAMAGAHGHLTKFRVKFGGLTVGKMNFGVAVDGNHYIFSGTGKTEGLADWFAPGNAVIKSIGILSGNKIIAENHFLSVKEKKKTAILKMAFKDGEVKDVYLNPDKRKKNKTEPKYVLIRPDDLKNVVDPASTLILPVALQNAKDPKTVCGRTYRVYDGETRFDIALSYKRTAKIKTDGYNGYAYVCKLRYIPVAGHKRNHKSTKRMARNNDMEIWMAPIDGGKDDQSIFTAIRINVPTWIGTFSAEPEFFGPDNS